MLRKCLLCLAAFLLLFTLAAAETAEEAAPAENPFIGVWQIAYYIHEGKLVTDPKTVEGGLPTMIEFHEETLTVHYPDGDHNEAACEYMGNTCSAWGASSVFTLEGKDLIICREGGLSFILTRIDPLVLNNPFIGTWIPLCAVSDDTVQDMSDWAAEASAVFAANAVQLIDGDHADTYPCTYADGACILLLDDQQLICSISEDGLLHMNYPEDSTTYEIICARENEELPAEISQFFGTWREVALLYNNALITDQLPLTMRPEDSGLLFEYNFSRATILRTCTEIPDFPSIRLLCTYADGTCTILYNDMPALCTIDENGLMCIRSEDGTASWLVRMEPPVPEIRTASAKGLLSDVSVTVTVDANGVITDITVDASGETQAIAKPCTEETFLSQFIGRAGPFYDIDTVSGATFTSDAVIKAVNSLYAD